MLLAFLKNIKHYFLFNAIVLLYIVLYIIFYYIRNFIYDNYFFYFVASYSDFKLWFPNFYIIAYSFLLSLKILLIAFTVFTIYILFKKIKRNSTWVFYNKKHGYWQFTIYEFAIALLFLMYYLSFYFIAKFYISYPLQNNLQLIISKAFLLQILFQATVISIGNFKKIYNYIYNYLLEPQAPYNLSIFRIIFFLYLIYIYIVKYITTLPTVSLNSKVSLPYLGWLIDIIPVDEFKYGIFVLIGIVCCVFIVVGYKTKYFLIINAICVFYIIATPNFFGRLGHQQLVIWLSWYLSFSKCYDVFSIDALLNKMQIVKSPNYTFPVRFVWLQFGVIYFWAGFHKLWVSGFDWALSQSMINQVQLEWLQHYDKIPTIRIDYYPNLLKLGGLAAILFELSYALIILQPAKRWISAIGGLVLHNTIGYFMYISFFHLLQVFYVFYINFNIFFQKRCKTLGVDNTLYKGTFFFCSIILFMNFVCGMFNIHTYPFSAYPTYTAIIPDKIKIIYFEPCLPNDSIINIHEIGKQNSFRWESYGWLEHNLIKDFEDGINIEKRLEAYWEIWQNHNPELKKYNDLKIVIKERNVSPEGINKFKTIGVIGELGTCY